MAALRFTRAAHDRLRWPTLAAGLANVPTAAWTTAMVVKRASLTVVTAQTHSYLLSGSGNGVSEVGSFFRADAGNQAAVFTTGTDSKGVKAFNNTTDTWGIVISKATGSATPRLGWMNLTAGGAMTYENFDLAQGNRSAATMLELGGWQNTADWLDGWLGVVGWWSVGLMSDANMAALFANKRTSDMWTSAAGQPKFLAECNVSPANTIDLAGLATGTLLLGASGPTLDTGETLAGWSFDGAGLTGFFDGKLDEVNLGNAKITIDQHIQHYTVGGGAATFDLAQRSFRLRNDDGNETTATWKATENANISQLRDANVRVRFEVQETGGLSGATTAQLQYSKNGGAFANVTGASTNVRASASPNVADGAAITDQLTLGTGAFVGGSFDEVDGAVASITLAALGHTEVEFCIQIRSADVAVGDTIDLRLTLSGDASPTYSQSPSITVIGALTTFTQAAFRLRNDDGDEATATWMAAQNTNATVRVDTNLRARFRMQETAAGSGAVAHQLQARKNAGAWGDVNGSSLTVRPALSPNVFDDQTLTEQLTGGTGTYVVGRFDELDGLASGDLMVASGHTEVEYCIQLRGVDVAHGDTIELRIVPSGDVTGSVTYTQTPSLTVSKAPVVTSFTPTSGFPGTTSVTITGVDFTGATSVKFNAVSAVFVVGSSTQITSTVPAGATTGTIEVTTPNGVATSVDSFTIAVAVSGGGQPLAPPAPGPSGGAFSGTPTIRIRPPGGQWETLGVDRLRGLSPENIEASSNDWGPDGLTFRLAAEEGARRPDLLPYTPVELEMGMLCWSGFVWQRPSDANGYSVGCRGWQYHLDDDLLDRVYVHTRLSDYVDYRSLLGAHLGTATQQGVVSNENGVLNLGTPNGSVLASGMYVAAVLDLGPDSTAIRAVLSIESSFNSSTQMVYVMGTDTPYWDDGVGRLDFVSGQALSASPWSGASQAQTFAGTIAAGKRYITIMVWCSAAQNNSADSWIKVRSCQLFRSASYESGNASILKSDSVIKDVLATAPLLNQSTTLVSAGTFSIPEYLTRGYITPRTAMEAVNALENYRLKIGGSDLRTLVYDPQPSAPIAEVGEWSGSQFSDATMSGEEIYDRGIVDATGPDGGRLVSKRLQAGTLVSRNGFDRARRIDVSSAVTQAVADRIADLWLTEHRTAPFAGTLKITGAGARRVLGGTLIPPHEFLLYAGDKVRLANQIDPDTGAQGRDGRIAGVTYRHDSRSVEIAIDDQRDKFETTLARYGKLVEQ